MEPLIGSGSYVLVNSWIFFFRKPSLGEIVVFEKDDKLFCKRIRYIDREKNEYEVRGDNPSDSLDSRTFGRIRLEQILGKAMLL